MSPDEARFKANYLPVTGGATPYLQQQNYSLAALARRDAQPDPFATEKPPPAKQLPGWPEELDSEDMTAIHLAESRKQRAIA
jgi:phage portal protein BeeE